MTISDERPAELDYRGEIRRKLLHLFALSMPIGYYLIDRPITITAIATVFAFSLLVDFSRFRHWPIQQAWQRLIGPIVRPKEHLTFTGGTHILLSGWLCPLLLDTPAAAMGMTAIILGDTAAALIGRRFGRHRFAGNRSYEGSLAFLLAALIPVFLIPDLPIGIGIVAALLATAVEALSRNIDDNLSVPIITALFVHLAMRVV
jgi:dolichol kinase